METGGQASDENSQLRAEDIALIEQALVAIRRDHARMHMQKRAEWAAEHGADGRAARFRMLDALEAAERDGRALTISMIGEAIGVDQPRASRLVQEASDAGLVRRTADPADARRSIIELTAAGKAQIVEVRSARRSAVEDALAGFTPDEAHTFAMLFNRFVGAWPRE
jgi:DNA-binding MarR family transcriptional regulator